MNNKIITLALSAFLLALCWPASAQQPKKVFRIGYLSATGRAGDSLRGEGLRAALRELGYIEGQFGRIFRWQNRRVPSCYQDQINLKTHQIGRELREPIELVVSVPVLNGDVDDSPHPDGFRLRSS